MDRVVELLQKLLDCVSRLNRVNSPWLNIPAAAQYMHQDYKDFKRLVDAGGVESHKRSANATFVHVDDLDALMRSYPSGAKVPQVLRDRPAVTLQEVS